MKELDERVEGCGKVSTDEIRRFVLTRLGKLEPEAADARQFFDRVFKDHLRRWEGGEGPPLGEEGKGSRGQGACIG
jgi:transcriptional repressor NrdR